MTVLVVTNTSVASSSDQLNFMFQSFSEDEEDYQFLQDLSCSINIIYRMYEFTLITTA